MASRSFEVAENPDHCRRTEEAEASSSWECVVVVFFIIPLRRSPNLPLRISLDYIPDILPCATTSPPVGSLSLRVTLKSE